MELSTDLGNSVCARFESEGVVCPTKLLKGISTATAVAISDHNPSSVTAQGAFYGTGKLCFRHPTSDAPGEERKVLSIESQTSTTKHLSRLRDFYKAVRPVILSRSEPDVLSLQDPFVRICPKVRLKF